MVNGEWWMVDDPSNCPLPTTDFLWLPFRQKKRPTLCAGLYE